MIRLHFYLPLAVLLSLCLSCGDGGSSAADQPASPTSPAPAAAPTELPAYPSIDVARLEHLFDNATYLDATFYNLPISMNQSSLPQIRTTLGGIAADPAVMQAGCAPAGHIWFQIDGKNIEDADIYFQPGCTFYVWYEDGKPAYSNQMTEQGVNFYQSIVNSLQPQGG
jgi:hypothetical protein